MRLHIRGPGFDLGIGELCSAFALLCHASIAGKTVLLMISQGFIQRGGGGTGISPPETVMSYWPKSYNRVHSTIKKVQHNYRLNALKLNLMILVLKYVIKICKTLAGAPTHACTLARM